MRGFHRFLAGLLCTMFGGAVASAQFVRPDGATTTSQFNAGDFGILNTINGAGMPGGFGAGDSHANYGAANHWTTAGGGAAGITATFTFVAAVSLDTFYLWNHLSTVPFAGSNGYAVQTFNLQFYDANSTLLGSVLNQSAAKNVATAQTYSFSEITGVRSVVFTILTNHGDASYAGLAEVGFNATAIPEPAEVGAWLAAAVLGVAVWRRRRPRNAQQA